MEIQPLNTKKARKPRNRIFCKGQQNVAPGLGKKKHKRAASTYHSRQVSRSTVRGQPNTNITTGGRLNKKSEKGNPKTVMEQLNQFLHRQNPPPRVVRSDKKQSLGQVAISFMGRQVLVTSKNIQTPKTSQLLEPWDTFAQLLVLSPQLSLWAAETDKN